MIYLPRVISILILITFLGACASKSKVDPDSPAGAFKLAQELEESNRYDEALARYRDVKAKHPYSEYALRAELAAADLHFKRKSFAEAQAAYQLFKQYHPSHAKIDYVTYQLAMSHFNQLPSVIGRDLSQAEPAIALFREVYTTYPKSEFAKPSREKHTEARKMLGEKQMFIGDFYFGQKKWLSALGRYENVIANYDKLGLTKEALRKAALSANRLERKDEARKYAALLKKRYPKSAEAKSVAEEVN